MHHGAERPGDQVAETWLSCGETVERQMGSGANNKEGLGSAENKEYICNFDGARKVATLCVHYVMYAKTKNFTVPRHV